jgi:protein-S-isoprenylcysteine O-methyltransferase Ste14
MHWFPDPFFPAILGLLVFGTLFIDYAAPLLLKRRCPDYRIKLVGLAGIAAAVAFRTLNWTVAPSAVQYTALLLIHVGLVVREWAVIKRGPSVARRRQVRPGLHQGPGLGAGGPYRWLRHPIYAGMVLTYVGIALALGTWLGGAVTLGSMLAVSVYRIRVEEQLLIEAYGSAYQDYMKGTWRLFPGW